MAPTRKYDARARRAGAAATRDRIIESAATLFARAGYEATAVREIAEHAEVSPETVYGAFGSKSALLARAIDRRVGGGGRQRPLVDQPWVHDLAAEPVLERRLALLAEHGIAVTRRTAPLLRAARSAALSDQDLAELLAAPGSSPGPGHGPPVRPAGPRPAAATGRRSR